MPFMLGIALLMITGCSVYASLYVRKHYYLRYPKAFLKNDYYRWNIGLLLWCGSAASTFGNEVSSARLTVLNGKIGSLFFFELFLLATCIMLYSGYQIIKKSLQFLKTQADLTEEDRCELYKCRYQEEQLRPYVKYWIPFLLVGAFIIFVFCVSRLNL